MLKQAILKCTKEERTGETKQKAGITISKTVLIFLVEKNAEQIRQEIARKKYQEDK